MSEKRNDSTSAPYPLCDLEQQLLADELLPQMPPEGIPALAGEIRNELDARKPDPRLRQRSEAILDTLTGISTAQPECHVVTKAYFWERVFAGVEVDSPESEKMALYTHYASRDPRFVDTPALHAWLLLPDARLRKDAEVYLAHLQYEFKQVVDVIRNGSMQSVSLKSIADIIQRHHVVAIKGFEILLAQEAFVHPGLLAVLPFPATIAGMSQQKFMVKR